MRWCTMTACYVTKSPASSPADFVMLSEYHRQVAFTRTDSHRILKRMKPKRKKTNKETLNYWWIRIFAWSQRPRVAVRLKKYLRPRDRRGASCWCPPLAYKHLAHAAESSVSGKRTRGLLVFCVLVAGIHCISPPEGSACDAPQRASVSPLYLISSHHGTCNT